MDSAITAIIATSIMPKRIEVQQAAIKSWQKLGFKVISVNVEAELTILSPLFEGVEFIPATPKLGKSPLIPISELLVKLKKFNSDVCGVVNSDIILSTNNDFILFLWENSKDDALVFGSRVDVEDINSKTGTPYAALGYDYFFFGAETLHKPLFGDFCLGTVCWDYWFPISMAINGVKLRHLIIPVGFHPRHVQGWDDNDAVLGRRKLISAIKETLSRSNSSSALSAASNSIIKTQGVDSFAGYVPSVLLLDADLVIHGQQAIPFEMLSVIVDTLRCHRQHYEYVLKSRSWRWTAPARFVSSNLRYLKGKLKKIGLC